ncbi:MAG: ATP-dependent DNA helicase RecG [Candidatus Peregrinibacteria bacterium GW2011_GWA2_43_8]|nr:MAG: ATP-dependent DNA helicase RecG [Candidatus Peregrinibacteria bacterium GW2011_GWA2_43_8]
MLDTKLDKVLRTTKKHISLLSSLGVKTIFDLLSYYPRTYTDERNTVLIVDMKLDQLNVIKGRVKSLHGRKSKNGMHVMEGIISDCTGSVAVIWFNQGYLERILKVGGLYYFSGKLKYDKGRSVFASPKVEAVSENVLHTARIVPVYHETEGLISKWIRDKIYPLLKYADSVPDTLPDWVKKEMDLCELGFAIKNVHFPSSQKDLVRARKRLAFNEVFSLQLKALKIRRAFKKFSSGFVIERADEAMKKFVEDLGFSLTKAQRRSLIEMLNDMGGGVPMLRLLQGDVGSGKTIVAALAALNVVKSGYQVAFMVPTEVLAKQHFSKLRELFDKVSISTEILTGSVGEKDEIYSKIFGGKVDVVIGTHALIQDKVKFKKLGLAIVDEQHRFGVEQRRKLANHGFPHLLSMTATPIPRTLAMIFYGDLDVSLLNELPKGRKPIATSIVPEPQANIVWNHVLEELKAGRQAYVVCPLIENEQSPPARGGVWRGGSDAASV